MEEMVNSTSRSSLSSDCNPEDLYLEALREETERKREAFMQLLAQRYPQYADKIQGKPLPSGPPSDTENPARSRDGQRRRTAVVTYQAANTLEYDELATMSDLEPPSFQRGGYMRKSLPIIRSASTSLERPLGLVFLVYGDQTKKSLLPNEITTLDTVRALFVRAFPHLTLDMLESPKKKIYLLDPATNIYFQLEDLGEIKDKSVLKLHETDSDDLQKVKERQEVRGRTIQMPVVRPHPRQSFTEVPVGSNELFKAQSLPQQASYSYPEHRHEQRNQWEMERRSRSMTLEPAERPRTLSAGAQGRQRFSHSPDRLPTPERVALNPIPENQQLNAGYREDQNGYCDVAGVYRGHGYPHLMYDGRGYPAAMAQGGPPGGQTDVASSTQAHPLAHPPRLVAPAPDTREPNGHGLNCHPLAFTYISTLHGPPNERGFQRTCSYPLPPTEREGTALARAHSMKPADNKNSKNRIEKMEAQLASLTAWVHYQKADPLRNVTPPPRRLGRTTSESSDTFPASSASSLSDVPDGLHHLHYRKSSGERTPINGPEEMGTKLTQLKKDLHILRRQQQLNMEVMKDEFIGIFGKIKNVLSTIPGAENLVNVHKRNEATTAKKFYIKNKQRVDMELSELEASVEELRTDIISRQCRVNMLDIEGMTLLLINVTKSLADIKAHFPEIHSQMKDVMDTELRMVVAEEKFLEEEPSDIETSLKRCKKLSGTLFTLKRLGSVQDHRPPQIPAMQSAASIDDGDRQHAVLENIRSLVPDHDHRVRQMEAADAARERKKKICTQQEALKFGKTLEIVTRNLMSVPDSDDRNVDQIETAPTTHVKPTVPAKPMRPSSVIAATSKVPPHSSFAPVKGASTSPVIITACSSKPSFSAAKPMDKPTATVSAMTSVSTSVSKTVSTMASSVHAPYVVKAGSQPVSEAAERLNNLHSGTGDVAHTIQVGTETSPSKTERTGTAFHTVSHTTQIKPPVFTKPIGICIYSNITSPTHSSKVGEHKSKSKVEQTKIESSNTATPKEETAKSVKWFKSTTEITSALEKTQKLNSDPCVSRSEINCHKEDSPGPEKIDLAAQKQAARSAFFSSMSTPPTSPSLHTNNRNSAQLDEGPVLRPDQGTGLLCNVTPGPTINLVLSGTVSPRSPNSQGAFTISPPKEIILAQPSCSLSSFNPPKLPSSPLNSPSRSNFPLTISSDTKPVELLADSHPAVSRAPNTLQSRDLDSEVTMRNKKMPPPPPPRKGSRPTSASMSSFNGGLDRPSSQETPRFVGGTLGEHRLSGGPLHATSKPPSQEHTLTTFEKDIATGLFANLNRQELQNQASSPQQMLSEAKRNSPSHSSKESSKSGYPLKPWKDEGPPIPPPPSVTMALAREERGSSSESNGSSSGTSMDSQQFVVSVMRSVSVSDTRPPHSNKPKPEPPRRHSSLLAKFTGSRDSKRKINNGKTSMNGVDL